MLRCLKPYELKDFLRTAQGSRGYMIPVAPYNRALQWFGMYTDTERTIVYFIARKIDNFNHVAESYEIDTSCIKYENGQYLYDETKLFDGYIPDGIYYFEVNDGYNSFYTEIFCVKSDFCQLDNASSSLPCSDADLISASCVSNPSLIVLKQFESEFIDIMSLHEQNLNILTDFENDSDYYLFEPL